MAVAERLRRAVVVGREGDPPRSPGSGRRRQDRCGPRREIEEHQRGRVAVPPGIGQHVRVADVDELLTPDSSRFWDASSWQPGGAQPSYDKQFVRDWLEEGGWPKTPPGPELPDKVVRGTRERYVAAFERITGASFARYLEEDVIAP